MGRGRARGAILAMLGALAVVAALLAGCGGVGTATPGAAPLATATALPATAVPRGDRAAPTATRTVAPTRGRAADGLPTIALAQLPPEAQETIRLIDRGGPFPYSRDGITFSNREGLLPPEPDGYYREYTVVTPGSADRGARRIVAGRDGALYYSDDHYTSFKRVVR
ncbi:MAG TPA: ribonuclease domain-containing protein [Thermomicrobiales bacterium]|nr:ribonuclease domain-containing protein [Thermomicrobiales bacterium]